MLMIKSTPLYYGKSPAWGDFLKTKGQYEIVQLIDRWIHQALEVAMLDPNFNMNFSQLPALDFFIAHPQQQTCLIANLLASTDSSGRRFPMVLSHLLAVLAPFENLFMSPFLYQSVLLELNDKNHLIREIEDSNQLQSILNNLHTDFEIYTSTDYKSFFEEYTLFGFAELMQISGYQLVQSMLGLGLLLQPVVEHGSTQLNKVLILPLNNQKYCHSIAAFWVSLICRFLTQHNTEVLIGILHMDSPVLLFGFQGVDISALSDVFNLNLQGERWVSLIHAPWIDQYLQQNAGLAALEQSLCERNISLNQGIRLFIQTFIDG